MVFPVVMYGCESWTVKKAEHQRIDAFELWYWRSPRPWDSPGKNTGVGCHFLLQCMKVKSEKSSCSVVSNSSRPHGLQPTRLLRPWDFPGKREKEKEGDSGAFSPCPFLAPSAHRPWPRLALPCSLKSATHFVGGKPEARGPQEAQAVLLLWCIGPLIHPGPWLPCCRMPLGTQNQGHLWRVKVREVSHCGGGPS